MDDLDRQIIDLLRTNGRRSNSEIARELEVSEGTIRRRLNRLIDEGCVQIVGIADARVLGYREEISFVIRTTAQRRQAVAEALAALPDVRYVAMATGAFDLIALTAFRSDGELKDFLLNVLPNLDGIISVESGQIFHVLKRSYDWLAWHDR